MNNFKGGEFISFSLKGDVNRLRTMYFYNNDDGDDNHDHDDSQDQQDDRDDQDDEDEEDDDDGPLSSAIFCERIRKLTRDETMNITVMLTSSVAFMGKPFVHRLTKTNIVKKVMVRCFVFFHLFLFITKYGEMSNIACFLFSLNDGEFRSYL